MVTVVMVVVVMVIVVMVIVVVVMVVVMIVVVVAVMVVVMVMMVVQVMLVLIVAMMVIIIMVMMVMMVVLHGFGRRWQHWTGGKPGSDKWHACSQRNTWQNMSASPRSKAPISPGVVNACPNGWAPCRDVRVRQLGSPASFALFAFGLGLDFINICK